LVEKKGSRFTHAVAAFALILLAAQHAFAADDGAWAARVEGEVIVFAAASLTNAFNEIGAHLKEQNPAAKVTFNFAGSQQLTAQILEGASPDVYASASGEQMKKVADAGKLAGDARTFATNLLAIAVEKGNPKHVAGLADLAKPGLVVVLAAEEVPAGKYARQALTKANVTVKPASLDLDVRAVLSKVSLGEADAGIVYKSDIVAAGDKVEGVAVAAEHNVTATYPVAILKAAPNAAGANAFVALLTSPYGREVLAKYGFLPP
jgi:molybdate transport system substrate-binding protein